MGDKHSTLTPKFEFMILKQKLNKNPVCNKNPPQYLGWGNGLFSVVSWALNILGVLTINNNDQG